MIFASKACKGRPFVKTSLCRKVFSQTTFGEGALDKVLVETKKKKKGMASTSSKGKNAKGKTFHSFHNYNGQKPRISRSPCSLSYCPGNQQSPYRIDQIKFC